MTGRVPTAPARVTSLRREMERLDLALCVLVVPSNQAYFTGFRLIYYPRPILALVSQSTTSLIVPACEELEARATARVDGIHLYYEQPDASGPRSHLECLARCIQGIPNGSRVGVEADACPVDLAGSLTALELTSVDIGAVALRCRETKDPDEIATLRTAAGITERAVAASLEAMQQGVTEIEADAAGNLVACRAASELGIETTLELFVITSSGPERTTFPHTLSTTRRPGPGDVVSHSRQVGLGGYRAEIERTIHVGPPTREQRRVFG